MSDDVQALIDQLATGDHLQQAAAAESLAKMETTAQPAAAALVAALQTADAAAREWCVAALEELGPPPATQIDELAQLAATESLDAAYWAVTLLGRAGEVAAKTVPVLIQVLESAPETAVRERSAWALGKLGPLAQSALPALQRASNSADPRLARLAKQALGKLEL